MLKYHHPVVGCDGNGECHALCPARLRVEKRRNDPLAMQKLENLKRLALEAANVDSRVSRGPGTELKKLLASLGIIDGPTCSCDSRLAQMNAWGVDGCRENRDLIAAWLREGAGEWGWFSKIKAGVLAVTTGLALKFDHFDPWLGLVDESIRLATPRFLPITTRDLIYHVYPLAGSGVWQWNVRQLLRRIELFNGRRIVAIAVDANTDPAQTVMDAFGGEVDEFLIVDNRHDRLDSVAYVEMLARVQSDDPQRAVMFGHAKGVSKPGEVAVRRWAEAMYEVYLDYWPTVDEQLRWHPLTGAFRSRWAMWPKDSAAAWFYSGSWAWYRSAELFATDWRHIDEFMFAAEPYPAIHFPVKEAGCLAVCDNPGNVYDLPNWDESLQAQLDTFYAANASRRTKDTMPRPAWPAINLATCITQNYVDRARPFLASTYRVRSARCYCVCMGFEPGALESEFPWIDFRTMPRHATESFGMLQHGRWLDAISEATDDQLFILSDADVILQRDFTPAEVARLTAYDGKTFGAAMNAPGDTLEIEAQRIGLQRVLGESAAWPCFNCGVLAARVSAWKQLRWAYESQCAEFYGQSSDRCRCQWLINWCLHSLGLTRHRLDAEIHSHGHFGTPADIVMRGGVAVHGTTPILFRHAL